MLVVFDKPEPIMPLVLPIIPYPKFILVVLNLFPSHHAPIIPILFLKILVCQPTVIYILAEYICVNKIDFVRNTS